MSNMLGQTASRDQTRTLPQGETVGTYTAYLDAQKAVDYLADQQFAVQNVSILGNDLKTVERVTGRLSYPRVALAGAATGAWFGLFVGVVLMLFGGTEGYSTLLSSMALGAGFWMLFGVITYAMQRGKRDFTSTSQVVASNYQVIVAPEAAGEARRLLQQLPMNGRGGSSGPSGPGYGQGYGPNQYGPNQYGPNQHGPGQGYGQGGPAGKAPERPAGWEDPYQEPKSGAPEQPQRPQGAQPQNPPYGQPTQGPQGQPTPPSQAPESAPGNAAGQAPPAEQGQAQQPQSPRRGQFPDLPDGRPQYGERIPAASQPASNEPGQDGEQTPSRPHQPPQESHQLNQPPQEPHRPERPPQDFDQSGSTKSGDSLPEQDERDSGDRHAGGSHPADEDRDRK